VCYRYNIFLVLMNVIIENYSLLLQHL